MPDRIKKHIVLRLTPDDATKMNFISVLYENSIALYISALMEKDIEKNYKKYVEERTVTDKNFNYKDESKTVRKHAVVCFSPERRRKINCIKVFCDNNLSAYCTMLAEKDIAENFENYRKKLLDI